MPLPALVGDDGLLPPGIHRATIDEIRAHFGAAAVPAHGLRREMIIDAIGLYARMIRQQFLMATIWVDGGLVTRKSWAAPDDADVVTLIDPTEIGVDFRSRTRLLRTTLAGSSVGKPNVIVKPMGGLIDGYVDPDIPARRLYWENWFSSVRLPDQTLSDHQVKGFVEVL